MSFFIFSLPRSGSAWLSVFLSYDGVFCHHEVNPFIDFGPDEGCVNTMGYKWSEVLRRRHRCFVLIRDYDEIIESSRKCGVWYTPPIYEFELMTKGLPQIEYKCLHDPDYLADVWKMVTLKEFDKRRATLSDMNIQNAEMIRSTLCLLRGQPVYLGA